MKGIENAVDTRRQFLDLAEYRLLNGVLAVLLLSKGLRTLSIPDVSFLSLCNYRRILDQSDVLTFDVGRKI